MQGISMLNPARWVQGKYSGGVSKGVSLTATTPSHTPAASTLAFPENQFDLLLLLDVALEVIHADREALKHVETSTGATEQTQEYEPAEHEATASVAPLLQFFELVHVGDTIRSMVQVYFDKEL
ncbi:hypothetical protein C0991_011670, partial [Blastosporella zonata]